MSKAMIFIDGSWLFISAGKLSEEFAGEQFYIDYGKLPKTLGHVASSLLRLNEIDVVRTSIFGSNAVNFDLRDEELVQSRDDFFNMLKEEYDYEVEVYPVNFRKRRIRKADRDPLDDYEPKEKCVDIALAASMLYYAAIPNAYDLAIVLVGDKDYIPALQYTRLLGKRVAIASIKQCCAPEFSDPVDAQRIKDTSIIWLNDLMDEIQLKYEKQLYECQSPLHEGNREFWTDYRPRRGEKVYCPECRHKFAQQKEEALKEYVSNREDTYSSDNGDYDYRVQGRIKAVKMDRGYGFIETLDNEDYFFHFSDLLDNEWGEALYHRPVQFYVKQKPSFEKAGAAKQIKLLD